MGEAISHDERTGVYRGDYDWSETRPSAGVVEVVAAAAGLGETDLLPLYEAVQPDALDAFVAAGAAEPVLRFEYGDRWVRVAGDGSVAVWPPGYTPP